jgi:hypothetical protein
MYFIGIIIKHDVSFSERSQTSISIRRGPPSTAHSSTEGGNEEKKERQKEISPSPLSFCHPRGLLAAIVTIDNRINARQPRRVVAGLHVTMSTLDHASPRMAGVRVMGLRVHPREVARVVVVRVVPVDAHAGRGAVVRGAIFVLGFQVFKTGHAGVIVGLEGLPAASGLLPALVGTC